MAINNTLGLSAARSAGVDNNRQNIERINALFGNGLNMAEVWVRLKLFRLMQTVSLMILKFQ